MESPPCEDVPLGASVPWRGRSWNTTPPNEKACPTSSRSPSALVDVPPDTGPPRWIIVRRRAKGRGRRSPRRRWMTAARHASRKGDDPGVLHDAGGGATQEPLAIHVVDPAVDDPGRHAGGIRPSEAGDVHGVFEGRAFARTSPVKPLSRNRARLRRVAPCGDAVVRPVNSAAPVDRLNRLCVMPAVALVAAPCVPGIGGGVKAAGGLSGDRVGGQAEAAVAAEGDDHDRWSSRNRPDGPQRGGVAGAEDVVAGGVGHGAGDGHEGHVAGGDVAAGRAGEGDDLGAGRWRRRRRRRSER